MNLKRPLIERIKKEENIQLSNNELGLFLAKFKNLTEYEYTNLELLTDLGDNILYKQFIDMIIVYNESKDVIKEL